jgi:uncharacterized caspase-like protein
MKKALLIGIDYATNPTVSLLGCINDVITIRNMLIDAYGYDEENITILRDNLDYDHDHGVDFEPRKTNILDQLDKLVNNSEDVEEIWVHYSGHGSQLQVQNSKAKDIIVPSNYLEEGVIQDDELLTKIEKISANCRAIFVFDCCHSGSICDMPWTFEFTFPNTVTRSQTNEIAMKNQQIFVLSGCRDNQTSADSENDLYQPSGAFTNAFLECLRESHHHIDIMDLYKKICVFLINQKYTQSPIFSSSCMDPQCIIQN